MPYYAVIDTNVIVSSLLAKNYDSATVQIIRAVFEGMIILLYNDEILAEYDEVLHRDKFHLNDETIRNFLEAIKACGLEIMPVVTGKILPDMDDLIFYETASAQENTYLVTGNMKHFPDVDFTVSPSEMMRIINDDTSAQ